MTGPSDDEWCEGNWTARGAYAECPNATGWKLPPPSPPTPLAPSPAVPAVHVVGAVAANSYHPTCEVGARILTSTTPLAASPSHARWRARVHRGDGATCAGIDNKAACCSTVDSSGDVCAPAVTTFSDGSVCAGWKALLLNSAADAAVTAACPPQADPVTGAARPRVRLSNGVGCGELTDRVACCSASDGRSMAYYANAPCVPATTAFQNGNVCASAGQVADIEVAAGSSQSMADAGDSCVDLSFPNDAVIDLGTSDPRELILTHGSASGGWVGPSGGATIEGRVVEATDVAEGALIKRWHLVFATDNMSSALRSRLPPTRTAK